MNKAELRKRLRARLATLSSQEIQQKSRQISIRLYASRWWQHADLVCVFCSMPGEVETNDMIQTALEQGKRVGVPRIAGNDLIFHQLARIDQEFVMHSYGIREPAPHWPVLNPCEMSQYTLLIVTPALAYSREKYRLGRGKGFYDRFFATLNTCSSLIVFRAGVCFSERLLDKVPVGVHDLPVDAVITEQEILG